MLVAAFQLLVAGRGFQGDFVFGRIALEAVKQGQELKDKAGCRLVDIYKGRSL